MAPYPMPPKFVFSIMFGRVEEANGAQSWPNKAKPLTLSLKRRSMRGPGETKRWLTRTNGRDVPIVDPGEITFKIQLKTTCDHSLRSCVEPLEVDSKPQRSRFQMKLRRAVRSRMGRQQW